MAELNYGSPPNNQGSYGGEPYIHLKWEDFRNISIDGNEMRSAYLSQKQQAISRFQSTLGGVSENTVAEVISNVTGLYDAWTSDSTQISAEAALLSDIQSLVAEMDASSLYKDLHHTKVADVVADVDRLNEAFDAQAKLMEEIETVDKRILDYYKERIGSSFSNYSNSSFVVGDGLETLSQTGKVYTSIRNWQRGWDRIEDVVAKAKTTGKVQKTVTVTKVSSKGEKKTSRKVQKVVGDTIGHLNNVKGEILEVGLAALMRGAIGEFEQAMKNSGFDIKNSEVQSSGSSFVSDPILGKKVTSKTDVGLSFEVGKSDMKINVGFSAKAQFKNGSKKKTSFLKSNYQKIMQRANLLNSYIEYSINNCLAHGKYKEAIELRKYVAANMALTAIGGLEKIDEVYFVVYMDKIISLPEILQGMADRPNTGLNLEIDRSGLKVASRMRSQWLRSHSTTESIRGLSASITGNT